MQTDYSELVKAIEAGVFALSLILLALAQAPLNSTGRFHLNPEIKGQPIPVSISE